MVAEDDDIDTNEGSGELKSMRGGIDGCWCWLSCECGDIGMVRRYSRRDRQVGGDALRCLQTGPQFVFSMNDVGDLGD